ncbi:MAG: O-antigen ligase family protein [Acidobacteria bacterium]|nr:O-antigen ligase family protein [Acidobacteriota bacterium]
MSRFRPNLTFQQRTDTPVSTPKSLLPPAGALWSRPAPGAALWRQDESAGPIERLGFWLLCIFLFHCSSRILDFVLTGFHIPLVISVACLICLLAAGRFFSVFSSRIGMALIAYSIWLCLSLPGSVWRGGSFLLLTDQWAKSLLAFVLVSGLLPSGRHTVKAIRVQAYGLLVAAVLAIWIGVEVQGRLMLPKGFYGSPNEVATAMVLACIYWWLLLNNPAHSRLGKAVALFGFVPVLYVMLLTGSRAGMVSLVCLLPFVFLRYSARGRLALVSATLLGMLLATFVTPETLRKRFSSILAKVEITSDEEYDQMVSATGSSRQRLELLRASILLTLRHPILGVGVGNFSVAEDDMARGSGRHMGFWRGTHNTYTQISSEAGIPALIAFLACLWFARQKLLRVEKAHRSRPDLQSKEIVATAFTLRLALYGYAVFFMFEHIGYASTVAIFLGMVDGFTRAAWAPGARPIQQMAGQGPSPARFPGKR